MRKVLLSNGILLASLCCASAVQSSDDETKALVARVIDAHGGADNVAKMKGVRISYNGVIDFQGNPVSFTGEMASQSPDRHRVGLGLGGNVDAIVRVFDGKQGFQKLGEQKKELKDEELAEIRGVTHQNYLRMLWPLQKDAACEVSSVGEVMVKDRPAFGLRVLKQGQPDINLYFARDTGLLVKSERRGYNLMQIEGAMETYYDDYKDIDGVKYPHTIVTLHEGKEYHKQEIIAVRFEEQIEDREFAKP